MQSQNPIRSLMMCGTLGLAMSIAPSAGAALLAQYTFDGNSPASTDAEPLTTATNWVMGDFGVGQPTGPNTTVGSIIAGDEIRVPTNWTGFGGGDADTLAEAIGLNTYASFTLQPNGNTVSLAHLTFDHWYTHGGSVATTTSVAVLTSATGFTVADALATFTFSSLNSDSAVFNRDVNLSAVSALQNLTTDVQVRIYFFDTGDLGTRVAHLDNIALVGSIIPEPASLALIALSGLMLLPRRRIV